MFAQSFNPFGVTDPFYLGNQSFYTDEWHRKRQLSRHHLHTRRSEERQMQLHQTDEEEMRRRRLEILKRYMEKPETTDNIATTSLGQDTEESDEMNCIPREVSIVQSQDSFDSEELRRPVRRRQSSLESNQYQFLHAENDEGEDLSCCAQLPHLIGFDDLDEDAEDDESVL